MLSIKDTGPKPTVWKTVDLKDAGKFEVELKKPTWDQLTQDSSVEERLKNAVVGWKDIEINGEEPEFTWDNFKRICEAVPFAFHVISVIVSDLYYSFGEEPEKNSEGASSAS